jgi:CRISPR-associated protein Csb1
VKPSEINHGNIVPSMRHEDKNTRKQVLNHGGVTLAYAIQHTVLSLAALRRLRFPLNGNLDNSTEAAARTVLAALGLAAICYLDRDGYDLRSRCLLDGKAGAFQFVGAGATADFALDAAAAADLLKGAVAAAQNKGLPWPEEPLTLQPSAFLSGLVVRSRTKSMAAGTGE